MEWKDYIPSFLRGEAEKPSEPKAEVAKPEPVSSEAQARAEQVLEDAPDNHQMFEAYQKETKHLRRRLERNPKNPDFMVVNQLETMQDLIDGKVDAQIESVKTRLEAHPESTDRLQKDMETAGQLIEDIKAGPKVLEEKYKGSVDLREAVLILRELLRGADSDLKKKNPEAVEAEGAFTEKVKAVRDQLLKGVEDHLRDLGQRDKSGIRKGQCGEYCGFVHDGAQTPETKKILKDNGIEKVDKYLSSGGHAFLAFKGENGETTYWDPTIMQYVEGAEDQIDKDLGFVGSSTELRNVVKDAMLENRIRNTGYKDIAYERIWDGYSRIENDDALKVE